MQPGQRHITGYLVQSMQPQRGSHYFAEQNMETRCSCRLGVAHLALAQWHQAQEAFAQGLALSHENTEMVGLHM